MDCQDGHLSLSLPWLVPEGCPGTVTEEPPSQNASEEGRLRGRGEGRRENLRAAGRHSGHPLPCHQHLDLGGGDICRRGKMVRPEHRVAQVQLGTGWVQWWPRRQEGERPGKREPQPGAGQSQEAAWGAVEAQAAGTRPLGRPPRHAAFSACGGVTILSIGLICRWAGSPPGSSRKCTGRGSAPCPSD